MVVHLRPASMCDRCRYSTLFSSQRRIKSTPRLHSIGFLRSTVLVGRGNEAQWRSCMRLVTSVQYLQLLGQMSCRPTAFAHKENFQKRIGCGKRTHKQASVNDNGSGLRPPIASAAYESKHQPFTEESPQPSSPESPQPVFSAADYPAITTLHRGITSAPLLPAYFPAIIDLVLPHDTKKIKIA